MSRSLKIIILFLWLQVTVQISFGQFVDNFSDNNFTANPIWTGSEGSFFIDDFQLRLQAPAVNGSAYLSTPSSSINNALWEFTLKLGFNPSSNNYTRVYLISSESNLAGPLDGYFVIVGGAQDEISLYRQSGAISVERIEGAEGSVNLSMVNVAIKVTRDNMGNWELFSDVGLSGTFVSEGTVLDNTFNSSKYFGVFCNYTSTRSDEFYFDDFTVSGDPYVDIDPPEVQEIEVVSSNQLIVHFNEPLDPPSATSLKNYKAGNNIGQPSTVSLQPNQLLIKLTFNQTFKNGISNEIQISGVKDLEGNTITSTSKSFLYFSPTPAINKDIVVSEIFADQSPQVGLPDAEYIEIYNRSENPFDLTEWMFSDGSSTAILPSKLILPDEYLVITATANVSKFGMMTNIIGTGNFPTLNNSGDNLVLQEPNGLTIDSVNYALSWYRSLDKQEGGWALEIIDPNNICSEQDNWTSSESESGGTPGQINSVFANKPDLTGPQLISLATMDARKIILTFNEKLEKQISVAASFIITPDKEISNYYLETPSLKSIILELNSNLSFKQLYTVEVRNLYDCSGNLINPEKSKLSFALPEVSGPGDVIINEILFNPRPNGVDFVELYNNSDKYINLKNWKIANYNNEQLENSKIPFTTDKVIAPGEYYVLTNDPLILKNNYPQGKEDHFYKTTLPSFPDNDGSVAIASNEEVLLDYFYYDERFHSEFVKNEEGVSLERISFSESTNNPSNWTSASAISGYATPGVINSNFRSENNSAEEVTISPVIFAPASGDFSQINYRFDRSGIVANVKILDYQGRLIKTLANNSTLSREGFFKWNGDQEDGDPARKGYYMVWFEVFDASGFQKTFRKRIVLASR